VRVIPACTFGHQLTCPSILRHWDLRFPNSKGKSRAARDNSIPLLASPVDPTARHGAARGRGITSLAAGTGPSGSTLFALGCDSRVHAYALPSLHPHAGPADVLAHQEMATNSFYARLALSPCGRWLASGGTASAAFIFDVAQAGRVRRRGGASAGVCLRAQGGEVTAVTWAAGALATCADDGTVRVWRADFEGRWREGEGVQMGGCDLAWAV
jgi:denticleless